MAHFSTRQTLAQVFLIVSATMFAEVGYAADWYTGDKSSGPDYSPSIMLNGSANVTSAPSLYGAVGATVAPAGGLLKSGLRGKIDGLFGGYSYTATSEASPGGASYARTIKAVEEGGDAMLGYAWVSRNWTFGLYAGAAFMNTKLSSYDAANKTQGSRVGGLVAIDFWGTPTKKTMVSGYASFSTVNSTFYTRFKTGYAIWNSVYFGPEISVLGNSFYTEYRVGIHATGIKVGRFSLGVSAGFAANRFKSSGAYGLLDGSITF